MPPAASWMAPKAPKVGSLRQLTDAKDATTPFLELKVSWVSSSEESPSTYPLERMNHIVNRGCRDDTDYLLHPKFH